MARLEIEQIPVLRDNYIYLLHDPDSHTTAVVDPALAEPVQARLEARGWSLDFILNTHHHDDHTGGNQILKYATGCRIVGAASDADRLPGLDIALKDGDTLAIGGNSARIIATPGHTSGHLCYWFADEAALFCGDTLFSLGCGRLFEGTALQMWQSLSRLRALPDHTRIYCAHEYTQSNAAFARSVDGANAALSARIAQVDAARAHHHPTVPSLLSQEKATNPFLRADDPALQRAIGLAGADPAEIFADLRRRKDVF